MELVGHKGTYFFTASRDYGNKLCRDNIRIIFPGP